MAGTLDQVLRRVLDVVVSAGLLIALVPLLAVIAVLVKATSPGPVLFVQERVGRDRRPFGLLKFRTMVVNAAEHGSAVTIGRDPRITQVGLALRRAKLDELPQFWNVLRGEMSLVGPRPEVPKYVAHYTPEQARVLAVRPGITDPASLAYHDEASLLAQFADPERAYLQSVLPQKLSMSLAYLERRSMWSDLGVLVRTALQLLGAPGATL